MPENHAGPSVQVRSSKPPGVIPKHLQAWLIGGIAVVMMLVIAYSGGSNPKKATATLGPDDAVANPSAARIEEYRARIEQHLQKLALEQARLAEARGRLGESPDLGGTGPALPPTSGTGSMSNRDSVHARLQDTAWMKLDRQKRLYESRYASSVALTRRPRSDPRAPGGPSEILRSGLAEQRGSRVAPPESATPPDSRKTYRLLEGTIIETVLTNRLDGSFSGPVNCLVTTNVYAPDRIHLLIPQGSRVLGSVSPVTTFGQQRLAVSFHRLITPDGTSVELKRPPGLSQVGETGLLDQVNRHYGQIFGVSLAIGAIAGLSQAGTGYGSNASSLDAYRQGASASLSQTSLNILDRYLNVLPTFMIREGQRIKVVLIGDLELPATRTTTLSAGS